MTWTLPEPMLAAPVPDPALPQGSAAEPKWDGWRALLSVDAGRFVLRSRKGTNLAPAFPEIRSASTQLPDATALDGELVVWESGRTAFERLQGRSQRRGAGAARLAAQWPAHFIAFDLLRLTGTDTTRWPYRQRRAALADLFAEHRLTAPWTLCPSTTDPDTVREWLTWTPAGLEGVVFKSWTAPTSRRCADGGSTRYSRPRKRSSERSPAPRPCRAPCSSGATTPKGGFSTPAGAPRSHRPRAGL